MDQQAVSSDIFALAAPGRSLCEQAPPHAGVNPSQFRMSARPVSGADTCERQVCAPRVFWTGRFGSSSKSVQTLPRWLPNLSMHCLRQTEASSSQVRPILGDPGLVVPDPDRTGRGRHLFSLITDRDTGHGRAGSSAARESCIARPGNRRHDSPSYRCLSQSIRTPSA